MNWLTEALLPFDADSDCSAGITVRSKIEMTTITTRISTRVKAQRERALDVGAGTVGGRVNLSILIRKNVNAEKLKKAEIGNRAANPYERDSAPFAARQR
jgi:hypothetical protein